MTCSSDRVRRGNFGEVAVDAVPVARTKTWELAETVLESVWGDSDSAGYTNRVRGRKDATGSMVGVFDNNEPVYDAFDVGDTVQLTLWENPTSYWYFACVLIQNFNITYNMDTKEAVEWNADWGADGLFYRPGASGAPSASYPGNANSI